MSIPKCEICESDYSSEDGNHTPRNLKCSHTICAGCAAKLAKLSRIICPFCREPTEVLGNNIGSLHKNFALIQVIQLMSTMSTKLKDVEEPPTLPKCKEHPYHFAEFVCIEPNCSSTDKLMCSTCESFGVHKKHEKNLLLIETENVRKSLQEKVEEINNDIERINRDVEKLEKAQSMCRETGNLFQKKEKIITTYYSTLRKLVDKREADALAKLKNVKNSVSETNSKLLKPLLESRAKLTKDVENANELMKMNNLDLYFSKATVLLKTTEIPLSSEITPSEFKDVTINIRPTDIPSPEFVSLPEIF